MNNTTFISCIDRGDIDKAAKDAGIANGFEYLEKVKQNCWAYLNFIFYLLQKDPVDFSGPETQIFQLLEDENVSWMPLQSCKLMGEGQEDDKNSLEVGGLAALIGLVRR